MAEETMTRNEMIDYLQGHFRYHTANRWNNSTSYAADMKIYNAPAKYREKLYDLQECEEFHLNIRWLIQEWEKEHGYTWQAGFNGRSGGYLVLYEGGIRPSGMKSHCPKCGGQNYRTAAEAGDCYTCGVPYKDFDKPPMQPYVYPTRGTDHNVGREEMEGWPDDMLAERVRVVKDFDRLVEGIRAEAIYMAENFNIEDEDYQVTKTRKVMVEKEAVNV